MSNVLELKEFRTCPSCKVAKATQGQFWKNQSSCIECSKIKQKKSWESRTPKKRLEQHLKFKYNLTMGDLVAALEEQGGGCAICLDTLPDLLVYEGRRRGYAIDHNHETGKFRGVLCLPCNSMLGMAKDSEGLLISAANYLKDRGSYHNMRAGKKKK